VPRKLVDPPSSRGRGTTARLVIWRAGRLTVKKDAALIGDSCYTKASAPVVKRDVVKSTIMIGDRRKRIVLIDDHLVVRQGLERLLNAGDEFVVCEEAGDAAEGLVMVRDMRPDAVIVDVGLPGPDGIELTKQLLSEFPNLIVLILSAHEEPEYAIRALHAGAMGYVVKSEAIDALRDALRKAFSGGTSFSVLEKRGRVV
jgi:CheY-like chemotaxis protein